MSTVVPHSSQPEPAPARPDSLLPGDGWQCKVVHRNGYFGLVVCGGKKRNANGARISKVIEVRRGSDAERHGIPVGSYCLMDHKHKDLGRNSSATLTLWVPRRSNPNDDDDDDDTNNLKNTKPPPDVYAVHLVDNTRYCFKSQEDIWNACHTAVQEYCKECHITNHVDTMRAMATHLQRKLEEDRPLPYGVHPFLHGPQPWHITARHAMQAVVETLQQTNGNSTVGSDRHHEHYEWYSADARRGAHFERFQEAVKAVLAPLGPVYSSVEEKTPENLFDEVLEARERGGHRHSWGHFSSIELLRVAGLNGDDIERLRNLYKEPDRIEELRSVLDGLRSRFFPMLIDRDWDGVVLSVSGEYEQRHLTHATPPPEAIAVSTILQHMEEHDGFVTQENMRRWSSGLVSSVVGGQNEEKKDDEGRFRASSNLLEEGGKLIVEYKTDAKSLATVRERASDEGGVERPLKVPRCSLDMPTGHAGESISNDEAISLSLNTSSIGPNVGAISAAETITVATGTNDGPDITEPGIASDIGVGSGDITDTGDCAADGSEVMMETHDSPVNRSLASDGREKSVGRTQPDFVVDLSMCDDSSADEALLATCSRMVIHKKDPLMTSPEPLGLEEEDMTAGEDRKSIVHDGIGSKETAVGYQNQFETGDKPLRMAGKTARTPEAVSAAHKRDQSALLDAASRSVNACQELDEIIVGKKSCIVSKRVTRPDAYQERKEDISYQVDGKSCRRATSVAAHSLKSKQARRIDQVAKRTHSKKSCGKRSWNPPSPEEQSDVKVRQRVYCEFPSNKEWYWGEITSVYTVPGKKALRYSVGFYDGDEISDVSRKKFWVEAQYDASGMKRPPLPKHRKKIRHTSVVNIQDPSCSIESSSSSLMEDVSGREKSLTTRELWQRRCETCEMCRLPDCGKCYTCRSNANTSSSRRQCCLQKMCETIPQSEKAQPAPGFPDGWRFFFVNTAAADTAYKNNKKNKNPSAIPGLRILRPSGTQPFRSAEAVMARFPALLKRDGVHTVRLCCEFNRHIGVETTTMPAAVRRSSGSHYLVGMPFAERWTDVHGQSREVFGRVESYNPERSEDDIFTLVLTEKSISFTNSFSRWGSSVYRRVPISLRRALGGCLTHEDVTNLPILSKRNLRDHYQKRFLPAQRVELLRPAVGGRGRLPELVLTFRGYKLVFSVKESAIPNAGLGVFLLCESLMDPSSGNGTDALVLPPGECLDLGIYAPFTPTDTRKKIVFLMKNFVHSMRCEAWSFDGPDEDHFFDITSDVTGEAHDEARRHIPTYVNEAISEDATPSVLALHDIEGNIHYMLGHQHRNDGSLELRCGEEREIYVHYGEHYEPVRCRKGYSSLPADESHARLKNVLTGDMEHINTVDTFSPTDVNDCVSYFLSVFSCEDHTKFSPVALSRALIVAVVLQKRAHDLFFETDTDDSDTEDAASDALALIDLPKKAARLVQLLMEVTKAGGEMFAMMARGQFDKMKALVVKQLGGEMHELF